MWQAKALRAPEDPAIGALRLRIREDATPIRLIGSAGGARSGLKRFEQFSFVAGILLLGWLVYRIGPGNLASNLVEVGWGFLLILALYAITVLLNSLSWQKMLGADARVPLRELAPMLVAGDAITTVNPIGLVGGSLVRVSLLSRALAPRTALISVGLASMTQFVGQVLFVLSGVPVALAMIREERLRLGLRVFCAGLSIFLGLVLLVGFSSGVQRRIGTRLARIHWLVARWESVPDRWRSLVGASLAALRERPGSFVLSVAASWLAWQTGVVGTFVTLRLLHQPVSWGEALAIEVLGVAIEGALFFVPGKMGTQEGGKVLIFLAMGLPPAKGFALGFLRRLRELAWALPGLAILGNSRRR